MRNITALSLLFLLIINCKQNPKSDTRDLPEEEINALQETGGAPGFLGNYVDDSYAKKEEGYDWVAVSVKQGTSGSLSVSVRSRADKKEPTCTFDTKAYPRNENIFEAVFDGKKIVFQFTEETLRISAEKEADSDVLSFFCSGGATIGRTYKKLGQDLDAGQIDPTSFSKVLSLQGVGFNVSSIEKDGSNTLTIFTFGLENREFDETMDIGGEQVLDATAEDLNSDGSPELFVFSQADGTRASGKVYAFSVNNKKSMSQVYFQPTAENDQINKGYRGHDEFAIVENSLVQRFPIYSSGDTDDNPTGGTRQVSYKLVEGEAMRKLEVANISEY